MPSDFRLNTGSRNAGLDAEFTSAQNGGLLRVYSGTRPAGPSTAITDQVMLVELVLNATAWAAASGGSKAANAITGVAAVASGTASFFRIFNTDGTTGHADGNVGTADECMVLPTTTVTAGVTVNVTSLTFTVPASA